jgi:hypothetical protein
MTSQPQTGHATVRRDAPTTATHHAWDAVRVPECFSDVRRSAGTVGNSRSFQNAPEDLPNSRMSIWSSIFFSRVVSSSLTTSAGVKTHLLRAGRRSRLSSAKESAEAAVGLSPRFSMSTPCARSVSLPTTVSAPNISSVTAHHDDACELPPFEGGGSPNQCFGHSRTRTNANAGTPA